MPNPFAFCDGRKPMLKAAESHTAHLYIGWDSWVNTELFLAHFVWRKVREYEYEV